VLSENSGESSVLGLVPAVPVNDLSPVLLVAQVLALLGGLVGSKKSIRWVLGGSIRLCKHKPHDRLNHVRDRDNPRPNFIDKLVM
jgi:hypothetical protein